MNGMGTSGADPRDKLSRFCEIFLDTFGEGDRLCPMCMLAMGQETIPQEVREGVREFWRGAESWLETLIETGQQQRRFRRGVDPSVAARTLLASVEGAMVAARAMEDRARLTDAIGYLHDSLAGQA